MTKAINFLGMTVGGYVGWYVGLPVSFFTAFMLSMVGTGLGLWGAYWAQKRFL